MNSKYRIDELNEPPSRVPGIRALLPLPGGDLLTGGTDLKIRRWDHCRYSYVLIFEILVSYLSSLIPSIILHLLIFSFVYAALIGAIVYVDHVLKASGMMISMRQSLTSECKLYRYFDCARLGSYCSHFC